MKISLHTLRILAEMGDKEAQDTHETVVDWGLQAHWIDPDCFYTEPRDEEPITKRFIKK